MVSKLKAGIVFGEDFFFDICRKGGKIEREDRKCGPKKEDGKWSPKKVDGKCSPKKEDGKCSPK